ncbi:transporter substrate-binding protein [Rhizobium sp. BK251]|uniref:transporter substrate-binding protein n=1 Tax=Rhizobium sp. BK251 TaxID=2512125 RepID=UPI0010F19157|nr:transporter substrate-binding protein [Rhizobium sp. BK251]TCL68332.1 amino acid/amide ABC transporter substrate-binding protein (HAAT family) [Rhizobium sp. BK251]
MSGIAIPVGVLFSRSGPYADLGEQGYAGALAGIEAVNAQAGHSFRLQAVPADPQGSTDRYATLATDLVSTHKVQHIVGCTTSWSRKEVIPALEKTGALLWYPCVYEGFEASENVVYVGACANQHILPLLEFALPAFGRNAFLLGSNYIWGWETCRIARDVISRSGGQVMGERHVPLGDTDIGRIVEEIRRKKPDFILSSLIGPSSHAFLEAYRALGEVDPDFAPGNRPVLSCNLSENEIAHIAPAAEGHFTIATYFEALAGAANTAFLASLPVETRATGVSAFFAQAYTSVLLIAAGLKRTRQGSAMDVLDAVKAEGVATPIGNLRVDAGNNHIHVPAHIARATTDGRYEIIREGSYAIAPDPFLTRAMLSIPETEPGTTPVRPTLRIVK